MTNDKTIYRALLLLLLISFLVRAFIAGFVDFGNDEVYYWTYAKFPGWSHFDHPPMVGWVIQFFTLNLHLDSVFFIRLGPVVFGTLNTVLMFLIGRKIKNSITGFYAAVLFTASIYCFILSGTFILPDTPQVLFWLLSLFLLLHCLPDSDLTKESRVKFLLAGVTVGLALLSKYHSVFLIAGVLIYILLYNRKWFRAKETYLAFLIAVILFIPVILWNCENSFISFTFHESRVGHQGFRIRWDYFGTEMAGQFFYTNPVNFIIILLALVAVIRRKHFLNHPYLRLLLWMSLPLLLVITGFSLFSGTLPHWTGPAYLGLIPVAAAWLSGDPVKRSQTKLFPWPLRISIYFLGILLIAGVLQIHYGILPLQKNGMDDMTVQLYGWKQLGAKFKPVEERDVKQGLMPADAPIVTYRWFPAANFDYYVARQLKKKVYSLGTLNRIHKYYWIDKKRGNLKTGTDAYYIALSMDYTDPHQRYGLLFDSIIAADTITIFRRSEPVWKAYVFRLYGLKKEIRFNSLSEFLEPSDKRIGYWVDQINTHPIWLQSVKDKARQRGATFDDVIWDDASWAAEEEKHNFK